MSDDPEPLIRLSLLCHELREGFSVKQIVIRNKFLRHSLLQSLIKNEVFPLSFLIFTPSSFRELNYQGSQEKIILKMGLLEL